MNQQDKQTGAVKEIRSKKGKTTTELMKEHMQNKDHVITDEELKNVIIGKDLLDNESQEALDLPDNKERPKDEDKDPEVLTPWDLLKD